MWQIWKKKKNEKKRKNLHILQTSFAKNNFRFDAYLELPIAIHFFNAFFIWFSQFVSSSGKLVLRTVSECDRPTLMLLAN